MQRQGGHQLLLLFPDGGRRLVPVAWTDAALDGADDRVARAAHRHCVRLGRSLG